MKSRNLPTIALSAKWHAYPERFQWIERHGFALEYAPNPAAFETLAEHTEPLLKAAIPVRFHGFFPNHEFGHQDATIATEAMRVHFAALEAIQGCGEQVITLHIGLRPQKPIDHGRAVENLTRLVERAGSLGITICLENLRRGPTSDPENVLAWARASGAMITLDIGHAVSCQRVQRGELTAIDFIEIFAQRLLEVHMYEREDDRHYAPRDMTILGPIVDRLLNTQCTWWTIELEEYADVLCTRRLLLDYLVAKEHTRSP